MTDATAAARQTSGDDAPALPPDAVEVGRVMGAWGVKGGIKVRPFAADPQALFSTKRWFVQPPARDDALPRPPGALQTAPFPAVLRVVQAKEHGDGVVATVRDLSDRNAAEALKGARLFVSRASFPTPGEGEFYWVDLIGLRVLNRRAESLGTVVGLLETGPHCVLRLQPPADGADETLIPFVDAYVDQVDLGARQITVDWEADY
jgi:16S rRNA processing protein RimM